jgi:phosphoribosylanthranilate isomerase
MHSPVTVALTSIADVCLLVATKKSSRLADIEEAKYTLEAMKLPPLGVVVRHSPQRKAEAKTVDDSQSREDQVAAARQGS